MHYDTFLFIGGPVAGQFLSVRLHPYDTRQVREAVTRETFPPPSVQYKGGLYVSQKVINPDTARIFRCYVHADTARNEATAVAALVLLDCPPVPGFIDVRERMVAERADRIRELMGL